MLSNHSGTFGVHILLFLELHMPTCQSAFTLFTAFLVLYPDRACRFAECKDDTGASQSRKRLLHKPSLADAPPRKVARLDRGADSDVVTFLGPRRLPLPWDTGNPGGKLQYVYCQQVAHIDVCDQLNTQCRQAMQSGTLSSMHFAVAAPVKQGD